MMLHTFLARQSALLRSVGVARWPARAGCFAVLTGVLLAPTPAQASVTLGPAVEVAAHASAWEMRSDVAMRASGDFVVVWERSPEPDAANVLVRRFAADGSPLGSISPVTSAPGPQVEPAIAIADNGGYLVAWSGAGAEDPFGVYARLFEADGSPSTAPFLVHDATPDHYEHAPSATKDGNGFAVAWVSQEGVHVVRLDASGQARGGFMHPRSNVSSVQIRDLPASRLALAWSSIHYRYLSQDSEGPVGRIDGVVLSSSDAVDHEFRANDPRPRTSYDYIVDGEYRVSLATSAAGAFALTHDSAIPEYVYNSDSHDGPYPLGAKVELFESSASSFGSFYLADIPADGFVADVAMTPGGNVLASVEAHRIGLRAIDCHGIITGEGLVYVSEEGDSASRSSIAVSESGSGVVVWSQRNSDEYSLAAQRFSVDDACALCGDADASGTVTATDALLTLRAAVGSSNCALSRCDVDGSSKIAADDALRVLRGAVAVGAAALACSSAPQIQVSQSAEFSNESHSWNSFALIPDSDGAVLLWSGPVTGGGQTVFRQLDAALDGGPAQIVAGPDTWRFHVDPAGCYGDSGLTLAWTSERNYYTEGITLDMSTVKLALPGGQVIQAHPDSIGQHRFGSVACLAGGRYAVSWMSLCGAVELEGEDPSDAEYFRPDECDDGPADGANVRVLEADGSPVSDPEPIFPSDLFHQDTALAPAGDDRFVAVAGPVIQVRSNAGQLLDEISVDVDSNEASLVCLGRRCARTDNGRVLLFDAGNLENLRELTVQPTMQVGPQRTITPRGVSLACETGGVCVLAWMAQDLTALSDTWVSERPGIYARPFDLDTGELGETVRVRAQDPSGVEVSLAAVSPGVFLLAIDEYPGFAVHRIEVR